MHPFFPLLVLTLIIFVALSHPTSIAYAFQCHPLQRTYKNARHCLRSLSSARPSTASDADAATTTTSPLISVQECLDLFHTSEGQQQGRVKFVDASWYHKGDRSGRDEFEQGPRIAGSCYLDLSDLSDHDHPVERMLPSSKTFAAAMDAWGIQPDHHVILYGKAGAVFVPRVWFMFSLFGHANTSLMQGTLEDWIEMGGPIEERAVKTIRVADLQLDHDDYDPSEPTKTSYSYPVRSIPTNRVVSLGDMREVVSPEGPVDKTIVVDARGSSFSKGYIPGSINIPYSSLLDPNNTGRFRPRSELEKIFLDAGVHPKGMINSRIICTCNSGVSACSLYLALRECGVPESALEVYDGSWQEYKLYPELPKVLPVVG
eukprot:scaffold6555_cov182-Amphora_coffeaeformis.AAC.10